MQLIIESVLLFLPYAFVLIAVGIIFDSVFSAFRGRF